MIAYTFIFPSDPTGENGPLKISLIAQSEEAAWQSISQQLNIPIDTLKGDLPTIQKKQLRDGELIFSRSGSAANPDDPWPQIVSEGVRDITNAISKTVGSAQKDRTKVELARLNIDRLVIIVFSIAFLGALAFAFYLITINNQDPVFKFVFPIITAIIGLISGYFAGRGSGDSSRR